MLSIEPLTQTAMSVGWNPTFPDVKVSCWDCSVKLGYLGIFRDEIEWTCPMLQKELYLYHFQIFNFSASADLLAISKWCEPQAGRVKGWVLSGNSLLPFSSVLRDRRVLPRDHGSCWTHVASRDARPKLWSHGFCMTMCLGRPWTRRDTLQTEILGKVSERRHSRIPPRNSCESFFWCCGRYCFV